MDETIIKAVRDLEARGQTAHARLLHVTAAERDELIKANRELFGIIEAKKMLDSMTRRQALEDAAHVASRFGGLPLGYDDYDEGYAQAAIRIRDAIRALADKEPRP